MSTISHRATWVRPDGSPIVAQHIDGVWRLTSGVLLSESAATPEQAVVLFTRAVREADPVLLLALLPDAERLHWSEERAFSFLTEPSRRLALIALLKGLKPTINLSHRPADAARVVLGDARGQIVLEREARGWKIADLQPHSRFLSTRDGTETGD
ncbi:MAG: hypothetical protein ACPGU1_04830 [Myxococcota bacterium]